jgi:FMN-dependent NADH-azoreductase
MSTLLHITASPKGTDSDSHALAEAFLTSYLAAHPEVTVDHFELFDGTLPAFGRRAAEAKMAVWGGGQPSAEQQREWDEARKVFDRFSAADAYLFTVPMWNSGIPYVLKQFIDVISQPGWLFTFTPEAGYQGIVEGKKAAAIYTSGVYSDGVPIQYGADFHASFFNDWLRFAGITDVTQVRWQPTILTASREDDKAAALKLAADAGRTF